VHKDWSSIVVEVAAHTTRFKLVSWSLSSGGNLIVTTDVPAVSLTREELGIIQAAAASKLGLSVQPPSPDALSWPLLVKKVLLLLTEDRTTLLPMNDAVFALTLPKGVDHHQLHTARWVTPVAVLSRKGEGSLLVHTYSKEVWSKLLNRG